ncbi:hypothetical protein [Chitinimonas sp. BJB300]|uniref:hypothetical protein n=1 Tax=Chitinimonas sp. BJB300 TaxID=1559339 RepID=UPI0011128CF4|nr:hypothetical protein [Chitinimonas sp. BJB300]
MPKRWIPIPFATVFSCTLLAGCGGEMNSTPPAVHFKTQKVDWAPCDKSIFVKEKDIVEPAKAQYRNLRDRILCANKRAPLDYATPSKRHVSVARLNLTVDGLATRPGRLMFTR